MKTSPALEHIATGACCFALGAAAVAVTLGAVRDPRRTVETHDHESAIRAERRAASVKQRAMGE